MKMIYFVHTDLIDKLELSSRCQNALMIAGIKTVVQFLKMDEAFVLEQKSMGRKSFEEVQAIKRKIKVLSPNEDESNITVPYEKECMKAAFSLVEVLPCNTGGLFQMLLPEFAKAHKTNTGTKGKAWKETLKKALVKQHMLEFLEKNPFGVEYEQLYDYYKNIPIAANIVKKVLGELVDAGFVTHGESISVNKPTLRDYASGIENKKYGEMFRLRLQGKTLEEIGTRFGNVTREGVRQIVGKCIKRKKVEVREDKYIGIFQKYAFEKDDFLQIFDIDEFCYMYLGLASDKPGNLKPELFFEDADYPAKLRKKAEEVLFRNYFLIGGKRVYKRRTDLADYVCCTYFQDEAYFDRFVEKYNQVTKQLGVHEDPKFIVNRATYLNRFSEADNVLWKYQSRFRYYDMNGYDFTSLFEGLDLKRYKNVEYSALKFFRTNSELMAEYDIRDEYELHNLLRKLLAKTDNTEIIFSRMPIIWFGKPVRAKQVFELLQAKAPIDVRSFCEAYEDEYGVLSRTVSGGFISSIAKYRDNNGIYNLNPKPLPKRKVEKLKSLLVDDYYDFSYILRLCENEMPDCGKEMLSSYSLNQVGFKVFTSYCIRDTFANAVEYFRHVLTNTDYVSLHELPDSLSSHTSFTSEMYSLKSSLQIIEYKPHNFINIRKLKERGISEDDLRDYYKKVAKFVKPNTHFTIKLIKSQGFSHSLHNEGFGDWFYSSLLTVDKDTFMYQRMGGSKVFLKGSEKITMESLFRSIVKKNDGMKFSDLSFMLVEEYGLLIDKYKIASILDASDMYYDRVVDRVYCYGERDKK